MYYGQVYMNAVCHAYNALYWDTEGPDGFEEALNKDGMSLIYLDHDYDYYILTDFIKKYGLDEEAIKKEIESKGFEYKN